MNATRKYGYFDIWLFYNVAAIQSCPHCCLLRFLWLAHKHTRPLNRFKVIPFLFFFSIRTTHGLFNLFLFFCICISRYFSFYFHFIILFFRNPNACKYLKIKTYFYIEIDKWCLGRGRCMWNQYTLILLFCSNL